jgi:hypothetical protein
VTHAVPGTELNAGDVDDVEQSLALRRAARLRSSARALRARAGSRRTANAAALHRHAVELEIRARDLVRTATFVPSRVVPLPTAS